MKHILCFGDSNTFGYVPGGGRYGEDVRWPMHMQKLLGNDYLVTEEGLNGRTCVYDDPVEGGFKSGAGHLPVALMSHKPLDLVIIMLGTNDTKERFSLNPKTIGDSMEQLIKLCMFYGETETNECPEILIVSPVPLLDNLMQTESGLCFGNSAIERSKGLAEVYCKLARAYGCNFFDAAQCAEVSPIDAVHLTPQSHLKLGEAMAEQVRKILNV